MADELTAGALPEAKDLREVPPVDTRQRMLYIAKACLVIELLWLLLWIGVMETMRVMKQPPPCPANPLKAALAELAYGMSEDEVNEIVRSHTHDPLTRRRYEGNLDQKPATIYEQTTISSVGAEGGKIAIKAAQLKILDWGWSGDIDLNAGGGWRTDLTFAFQDDALRYVVYHCGWESHGEDKQMDYRAQEKK